MSDVLIDRPELEGLGQYEFGWHDSDEAGAIAKRGLSEQVVREISALKNEPEWMLERRLKALKIFGRKPMPTWGAAPLPRALCLLLSPMIPPTW